MSNTARFIVTVEVADDADPQLALLNALNAVKGSCSVSGYAEPADPLAELRKLGETFKAAGQAFADKMREGMGDGR